MSPRAKPNHIDALARPSIRTLPRSGDGFVAPAQQMNQNDVLKGKSATKPTAPVIERIRRLGAEILFVLAQAGGPAGDLESDKWSLFELLG